MQYSDHFIALFDILGFKNLVQNNDLEKVFETYDSMKKETERNLSKINEVSSNYSIKINYRIFSDTFFFYTSKINGKSQDAINETFEALMAACYFLLRNACRFSLPLRGAMTAGELIVTDNIEIGIPIIDVYEKEKNQDWIGCLITEDCLKRIDNRDSYLNQKEILRYKIPLKSGKIKKMYALNWLRHEPFIDNFDKILNHMELKAKNEWEIKRKYRNTRTFIDFLKKEVIAKES